MYILSMSVSRLWRLVTMSMEQQRTVEELWLSDGYCVCGCAIRRQDAKLCMAQINSSWCVLEAVRNTLAVGIYCSRCAELIEVCLKSLKKLPERDRLKSHIISNGG
jgi:hypothetical protein